ncbi:hypothetical protein ACEWY4_002475 [Coilia grayii]|uniref:AIG1-type G domain-containing protein n=1 Tax=Coilia grayii TaxID=363190 RepID=A0ABD1KNN0_9TELE
MTPLDKQWVAKAAESKEVGVEDGTDKQTDIYKFEELPEQSRRVSGVEMEEWRIMLLGRQRVGKSSTGNTILRQAAFPVNMSLGRITQFCDRKDGTVDGRPVAVIDTPGLKNAKGDEKKVIREILRNISLYKPGPHIFLIVLPIGNLTHDDIHVHKIIERMFGKKDMANRAQVTVLMERIESLMGVNGNAFYPTKFYPRSERRIRKRQEKHMERRAEVIAQRERQLEDLYSGDELEEKRLEVWRSTDKELRSLSKRRLSLKKNIFRSIAKRRGKKCQCT